MTGFPRHLHWFPVLLLLVLVGGGAWAMGVGYGVGLNDGEDGVDRRKDPATGCAAMDSGIRALLAPGNTAYSEPVKAQLLDGLLLNYRNLECGITKRTALLLDLVKAGATAPAPGTGSP
ncbi:hypothetical protein HHL28_17860 [Aerophototrophica crusticola]|uniref:Uncharacterized protein n=1 Tax=Aerophototrophica crusticola TaxID=1709002 RepID=A0A858RCM9_9PROT|nr:hypothetical protein HHL28_17860 [Rhodospirillaceae bacterium B3]